MVEDKSTNQVSQHNNIVPSGDIVGRDKNVYNQTGAITLIINITLNDYKDFITFVSENESSILLEKFRNQIIQEAFNKIKNTEDSILRVDKPMQKNKFNQNISEEATSSIDQQQFGKAHRIFGEAINDPTDEHFNFFLKQYLITGFIYYRQENDMNGLRTLLSKKATFSVSDHEIDLITANIFQEVCSRESDLKTLTLYLTVLEDLYHKASTAVKSPMANSLGLAYRRLGERTGVELLQKAILIFDEGLSFNQDNVVWEADLKDQKAITHVRIFEFNKDESNLIEAEKLLIACVDLFKFITDPLDIRLKPRILNNLGNVYKQKALFIGNEKRENATKAIYYYEQAENFWSEPTAKYEWALLQKNKAEAKYALAKVTRDSELLIDALKDCSSSVKYRDLQNSPYQWGKSVDVIFQIVLLLRETNSLSLIPKQIRENIILYTRQIDDDNTIWGAKNFTDFLTKAKQAQTFLKD